MLMLIDEVNNFGEYDCHRCFKEYQLKTQK